MINYDDKILRFYMGDRKLIMEERLSFIAATVIHHWDNIMWEGCHNHVQWVFPTDQPSQFNLNAPLVTRNTIDAFENYIELSSQLDNAFRRFIRFLNETLSSNFEFGSWLTPDNHNLLRITRVIRCMNLFGMRENAKELYEWMSELYADPKYASIIGPVTWKYWTDAYNNVETP